ncbi:MAG: TonB-dependent receptor, partial [Myxococcales bacterium]|nr:TonB-dependent receptor [Myxococcales bacterium]
ALTVLAPSVARAQDGGAKVPAPYETVVTAPTLVTAASAPREDRAASASVVVPADSPRAHDDLGSLMLEVPGVSTTRTGSAGSFTTLSLRGSNPDQVRVFIDGVPLNIAEGGAVDLSTLPLGDVERVEVYRGQAPLSFGESALGGILSITTRTPGVAGVGARAGVGSVGTRFGDVSAGGHLGGVRLYAGVHGLSSTGVYRYFNDNCTPLNATDDAWASRQNNDVEQADGTLRAATELVGRRTLSLGVVAFGRNQGLPGSSCAQTQFVRFATARALAYLRYEDRDSLGDGGRLSAQIFASRQRDHYTDPGELSAGAWNTRDDTQSAGATANASRAVAGWLRLALVAEARAEIFQPQNAGEPMPVGSPARRLVAVGGVEPTFYWHAANLDVIPSVRVELQQDVVTGRDPLLQTQRPPDPALARTLPVWRVAMIRPLGGAVALKGNVGRYARAPSFLELYAGSGRLLGNPALRPERGTNGDLAVTVDASPRPGVGISTRTAIFGARVEDLIEWEHDPYGHSRADNVAAARVLGAEQEVRLVVGAWGRLVAQGTYLEALDHSGVPSHEGKQLPFRPRWQGYLRPELARLSAPHGVVLGAYVDGAVVGGLYDVASNLHALPARFLVGAGLSAEVPRWGLRAVLSGQDLTRTWTNDLANYPVPSRTIYLALAWQAAPQNDGNGSNENGSYSPN